MQSISRGRKSSGEGVRPLPRTGARLPCEGETAAGRRSISLAGGRRSRRPGPALRDRRDAAGDLDERLRARRGHARDRHADAATDERGRRRRRDGRSGRDGLPRGRRHRRTARRPAPAREREPLRPLRDARRHRRLRRLRARLSRRPRGDPCGRGPLDGHRPSRAPRRDGRSAQGLLGTTPRLRRAGAAHPANDGRDAAPRSSGQSSWSGSSLPRRRTRSPGS